MGYDPQGLTRIEHIMLHTKNDLTKPVHGVWNMFAEEVVTLASDIYSRANKSDPSVTLQINGIDRLVVELTTPSPVPLGWLGGFAGAGEPLYNVRLVIEYDNSITFYPK